MILPKAKKQKPVTSQCFMEASQTVEVDIGYILLNEGVCETSMPIQVMHFGKLLLCITQNPIKM